MLNFSMEKFVDLIYPKFNTRFRSVGMELLSLNEEYKIGNKNLFFTNNDQLG